MYNKCTIISSFLSIIACSNHNLRGRVRQLSGGHFYGDKRISDKIFFLKTIKPEELFRYKKQIKKSLKKVKLEWKRIEVVYIQVCSNYDVWVLG